MLQICTLLLSSSVVLSIPVCLWLLPWGTQSLEIPESYAQAKVWENLYSGVPWVRGKLGDNKKKGRSWSRNKQLFHSSLLRDAECTSLGGRGFCWMCCWLFLCTYWDIVKPCCPRGVRFVFSFFLHLRHSDFTTCKFWSGEHRLWEVGPYRAFWALLKPWHCSEGNERFLRLERVCRKGSSCSAVRGFDGELWRNSIWFLSTATAVGTCVELDVLILWLIFWGDPV